jgi:hypothetical protein
MKWSSKKPNTPGWYWWRNLSKDQPATLVEVKLNAEGFLESGPPANFIEGRLLIDTLGEEWAVRGAVKNWRAHKPAAPGWYWYRPDHEHSEVLVHVHRSEEQTTAVWPDLRSESVFNIPGEWSGPLDLQS